MRQGRGRLCCSNQVSRALCRRALRSGEKRVACCIGKAILGNSGQKGAAGSRERLLARLSECPRGACGKAWEERGQACPISRAEASPGWRQRRAEGQKDGRRAGPGGFPRRQGPGLYCQGARHNVHFCWQNGPVPELLQSPPGPKAGNGDFLEQSKEIVWLQIPWS